MKKLPKHPRVLVCGGRTFEDIGLVAVVLEEVSPCLVIQGGARGADSHAKRWAVSNGVASCEFPACWENMGAMAGPIRNRWMLEYGRPQLVLAFPGGRGTANMVSQAEALGIAIRRVR